MPVESAWDGCQVGLASLGSMVVPSSQALGAHTGAAVATISVQKTKAGWCTSKDSPPPHCDSVAQTPTRYTNPVITEMRATRCCLPKVKKQKFETTLSSLP